MLFEEFPYLHPSLNQGAFFLGHTLQILLLMTQDLRPQTHGFVGADLESLAKESAMCVLRKTLPDLNLDEDKEIPQKALDKMIIGKEDFESALKVVRPSAMREVLVETPNVNWEDIG